MPASANEPIGGTNGDYNRQVALARQAVEERRTRAIESFLGSRGWINAGSKDGKLMFGQMVRSVPIQGREWNLGCLRQGGAGGYPPEIPGPRLLDPRPAKMTGSFGRHLFLSNLRQLGTPCPFLSLRPIGFLGRP